MSTTVGILCMRGLYMPKVLAADDIVGVACQFSCKHDKRDT